ncbi:PREDICTED: polyamine oxidase-like [Amphimedon queenslandica]|uniref:Amine oxidase domain-containing protein n=1 Tax=Amphimedon queenslandica TaxID=400682 RepID=A0A1X7SYB2_AMPQE|nr:PREDICTED: polyamine oxidase-like [Amphimedon queenslandica]|eukprot:XP_011408580.1 PREDICTED: polyamine oxidase-like [Amphimedon queenslandica]
MVLFVLVLISVVLITSASSLTCPSQKDAEVLIFGAGTAGVTAARVFNDHGLNSFKVLEAYGKIGGRIRNVAFKGVQIEVGANWIHEAPANTGSRSDNDNPIWTLARHSGCYVQGNEFQGSFTSSAIYMDLNDRQQFETVNADNIVTEYMTKYEEAIGTAGTNTVRQGLNINDWHPDSALKQVIEWSEFDFTYATTPENPVCH